MTLKKYLERKEKRTNELYQIMIVLCIDFYVENLLPLYLNMTF